MNDNVAPYCERSVEATSLNSSDQASGRSTKLHSRRVPRSAKTAELDSAVQLRGAMGSISTNVVEAASVVRAAAEDAGSDATWGALRLLEWLRDRMAHRLSVGQLGSFLDGPFPDASADIACAQAVLKLVAAAEKQVPLDAALTILQSAQDIANMAIDHLQLEPGGNSHA